MAKHSFSSYFSFKVFIFVSLTTDNDIAFANTIRFHKNSNQRYTHNILASYTDASLTPRICSVKCIHTAGCDAYNFWSTSSADKICETVKIGECTAHSSENINGWNLYSSGKIVVLIFENARFIAQKFLSVFHGVYTA